MAKTTKERKKRSVILLPLTGKGRVYQSVYALAEHFGINRQTVYLAINQGNTINAGGNKCFVDYAIEEKTKV